MAPSNIMEFAKDEELHQLLEQLMDGQKKLKEQTQGL